MVAFQEWLFAEERSLVDRAVLSSYDRAFQQQLEQLIGRTKDPELRKAFSDMRECPIKDRSGHCRSWAEFIVSALIRHGCHHHIDLDDALQYIVFRMLSRRGEKGQPSRSIFDFDESRPYDLRIGNPLQAIFRTYLMNDLRSVCSGKVSRLKIVKRPTGTLTIGQGSADSKTVSPEAIPDRPHDSGSQEMLEDIFLLLKQRCTPKLDLVALFQSIVNGEGTREQRRRFGYDNANRGRKVIVQTIRDYARNTQNWHMLNLLDKFKDFSATKADPKKRQKKPKLSSNPIERDYQSIATLVHQLGGKLNSAQAGRWRRRWAETKPRDLSSPYPNRLADSLANMVRDGVLLQKRGNQGGAVYLPGPNFAKYLPQYAQSNVE